MTPLSRPTRLRTKDRDIEGLHLSLSGRPFRVNRRHTLLRFSALATTDQATPIQEARQHHFDRTILAVGVFIVFWKMHGLKLPSEIAAEHIRSLNDLRAQSKQPLLPQVRVRLWTSIADWIRPWRWGRGDLLKSSTPTGGDFGAHVWLPDFVRRSLLPKGRLTGWSNDFFGGFPALGFYFPLPAL